MVRDVAAYGIMRVMVEEAYRSAAEPSPPAVNQAERTVTLITGDKVTLGRDGRGVRTRPAPGREDIGFMVRDTGERLLVVPAE